jgi:hypothetical protein
MGKKALYERLGGHDAVSAVVNDLSIKVWESVKPIGRHSCGTSMPLWSSSGFLRPNATRWSHLKKSRKLILSRQRYRHDTAGAGKDGAVLRHRRA